MLEQRGDTYRMFEVTRQSLLPIGSGEIRNGMILYADAPVMPFREFQQMSDRVNGLPRAIVTKPTANAEKVFDVFWTTIDENYAFFDLAPRSVWARAYAKYRPQVKASSPAPELWTIFSAMIRELNDGHTALFDLAQGKIAFSRAPSPSDWMLGERGVISDEYAATITSYLDALKPEQIVGGPDRPSLFYGVIGGRVGYLNILSFDGYSSARATSSGAADQTADPAFSILTSLSSYQAELAPFSATLDRVFSQLASTDALIIDLRFNQGGSGDLVVALANRLTAQARLAYSYRVRFGGHDDFDAPQRVMLAPKSPGFRGKSVIVLTSNTTKSAGDLATMILRELPKVTVIGEKTYGIFSEGIPRQVPLLVAGSDAAWTLTVSTQRVYSARGEFFEQRGVPPDHAISPNRKQLAAGRDNMLDAALRALGAAVP